MLLTGIDVLAPKLILTLSDFSASVGGWTPTDGPRSGFKVMSK
jgi:hypothetical protein